MDVQRVWVVMIVCFLGFVPFVYAGECRVSQPELKIFFSNGMFNARSDAFISKNTLRRLLSGKLPGYRVSYDIAYNHNENPMNQVLEVARNKMVDDFYNA